MGPHHQGLVMQLSLDLLGRWMEEHAMEAFMVGGGDEEERELTIRGLATYQPYNGILALKMLHEGIKKSGIMGLYDPCPGDPKLLLVEYTFHGQKYKVMVDDYDALLIPQDIHQI